MLDAQRSGYGASVFLDPAHLDRQGACTLSADVGDLLRARVGIGTGRRWIALPAYRDLATGVPMVNLAESQVALAKRRMRR